MIAAIKIDVSKAREILMLMAGSPEHANFIQSMTEDEIKNQVIKHIKCFGVTEVKCNIVRRPKNES